MSTTLSEFPAPLAVRRRLPWHSLLLGFLLSFGLTLLAVAVFAAAFAAGLTRLNDGRALPGVTVGGVALAGLDRASAEVRVRDQLPSMSSGHLTVRYGEVEQRITYADIGRDYDMATMLDRAFGVGHDGNLIEQAQEQLRVLLGGVAVEPSVRWDEPALEARLLAIAQSAVVPATDATIVRVVDFYMVRPAVAGRVVDVNAGLGQALAAVGAVSPADGLVHVDSTPVVPSVGTADAQAFVDQLERVAAADLVIAGGPLVERIEAETIRGWLALVGTNPATWRVTIDRTAIDGLIAELNEQIYVAPRNASFAWRGEEAVPVAGANGRELNTTASGETILAALNGRLDGGGSTRVSLSIVALEPEFTTDDARALAPRVEMLSTWTTNYIPSERNFFGANISVPTRVIDGTVIGPGEKFDFWSIVGSLADYPEIGPGGVIIRGRTDPTGALGGGICSCSTTIFNAALRAGLDMGARRNHAYYITRYPVGLDATVFKSRFSVQNLTWTNDTPFPVIVRGINRTGKVTFQIWGVPTGRTVTFSEPIIENEKVAKDFWEYSDKIEPGTQERIEFPTDGFEVWVTRTVTDEDGNEIHEETYYSRYIRVHGITLIGRNPTDPPAGTRIER